MSIENAAAVVRRQELTCTEEELDLYPNKILAENEILYVRMNDGTVRMKMGDGKTSVKNLQFTKVIGPEIVQSQGNSITSVMSQKAVTDADIRLYTKASMVMDESRNLFDGYIIPNTVIDSTTGAEKHSDNFRTTRYIEVEPSHIYTLFAWGKYSFYDAYYNYISSAYTQTDGRAVMTTPDNCKFVRIGTSTTNLFQQQIYKGDVDASKTTYEAPMLRSDYLGDSVVHKANNAFNLFNGVVVEKTTINGTTGLEEAHDEYRTSEYIAVTPTAFYTAFKWTKIMFYKKDYTFLSWSYCSTKPIVQIPEGCYYVRLCTTVTKRDQMFLQGGVDGFYYLPYKETIPADLVERPIWKDKTYFYDKIEGYYHAPKQEAFNPDESGRTVESIYGIYDELMAAYQSYITKTDLGLDQNGQYHLYRYDFKPESPVVPNLDATPNKHLPKIMIFSGVHGFEAWSVYAIAQLMKLICTNPNNDPILDYYRHGIEFIVVPLVNPWGYVAGKRWNSRGVNINRNFFTGWEVSGTESFTDDYEGAEPFSEAETAIVKKLLEENLDAFAVIDAHNHHYEGWNKMYWSPIPQPTDFFVDGVAICRTNMVKLTKSLKNRYNKDFEGFCGYVENSKLRGTLSGHAAKKYRMNAMTAESNYKLVGEESGSALTNQVNVEFYANLIAEIIKYYQ